MAHKEYRNIIPNSKTSILFIHGILGTPDHFSDFIKEVPPNWSIYNILLIGHGKTVNDFSNAIMDDWKNQIL